MSEIVSSKGSRSLLLYCSVLHYKKTELKSASMTLSKRDSDNGQRENSFNTERLMNS